ncbi:trace amine-associated receptor 9-like [Rhopilema esculentum]|uniref:trace amine-associated receptor 9-like n=1 Tax=Rhopilema esculentum TaxID=499914 RepID=UPI0031D40294|eukprot:gene6725-12287_t
MSANWYDINIIIFLTIDSIVALLTSIFNGTFIVTLLKTPSLHTPSHMIFGAMSMCDFLVGICGHPLWLEDYGRRLNSIDKSPTNKYKRYVMAFLVVSSLLYMTCISIDRYIAVVHPFWFHEHATCKTHIIASVLVLFATIPIVVVHFSVNVPNTSIMLVLLPVIYCNWKVFSVIRRQSKQIAQIERAPNITERQQKQRKENKDKAYVMLVVVIAFCVSYAPTVVNNILVSADFYKDVKEFVDPWAECFIFANSLVNPLIYYARMKAFRKAAKDLFHREV